MEHYRRQAGDQWLFSDVTDADAALDLPAIQCVLRVREVYEKVTFEE